MIWVLGYPGSGTLYTSKCVNAACPGGRMEEPFTPQNPDARCYLFGDPDESRVEKIAGRLLRYVEGHCHKVTVTKEEFAIPYHMLALSDPMVYILRDTLANVAFILKWPALPEWMWYFNGICQHDKELATAMWPEKAPTDSIACTLAIAHELQTWHDRKVAQQVGVPVFRYENLSADYVTEWPRLLRALSLGMNDVVAQLIQKTAAAPFEPLFTENKVIDYVGEIQEKAKSCMAPGLIHNLSAL